MRVADWIAEYLHSIGVRHVHGIMGGGAAGLNDGFVRHPGIEYVCYHHEQGAGHAAIGESKYTGALAVVNPTTGCAGTNCATSVLNAWQDGVPVLFLSGNVRKDTCSQWINKNKKIALRHYGIQEHSVSHMYNNMTKFSHFLHDPGHVQFVMHMAVYMAMDGRRGPVWVDIPSDVQSAEVPEVLPSFKPIKTEGDIFDVAHIKALIGAAERPVVIAGQGIRQSGTAEQFVSFVEQHQLPFVTTYGSQDLTPYDHPLNVGVAGIRGTRAGNFAMQNADLLLVLGSSLNAAVVGYDPKQFSPASKKIYVDVDVDELEKDIVPVHEKLCVRLPKFFEVMQ